MSQGIWRICLFHPRFCQIWDKSGKRFHVGMAEWLFLRSPSSIFRWELWDWDRSGAKMFQLFNTDFPNLFPLLLVSFFQEKKPTKNGKKQGKKVSNGKFPLWNSALEGKCLGMVEEGGWTQNWEQILGLFLLLDPLWNSGFSEISWIPFGIPEFLRAFGSPLKFGIP